MANPIAKQSRYQNPLLRNGLSLVADRNAILLAHVHSVSIHINSSNIVFGNEHRLRSYSKMESNHVIHPWWARSTSLNYFQRHAFCVKRRLLCRKFSVLLARVKNKTLVFSSSFNRNRSSREDVKLDQVGPR